jgi:hypothetical protein
VHGAAADWITTLGDAEADVLGRAAWARSARMRVSQRMVFASEAGTGPSCPQGIILDYMLRDDQDYHDLGAAHFQRGDHERLVAGLTRRLHHLGYEVTLRPAA